MEHNKAVDEANAKLDELINDIADGYDVDPVEIRQCNVPTPVHDLSDTDRELHEAIDRNINTVWATQGKLYIGRLPQAGPLATAQKGKKSKEIDYFSGEENPSRIIANDLDVAASEVSLLRYYTASPLYEFGHFLCRILLLMLKVLQGLLACNENLHFDEKETFSFLPLLFSDVTSSRTPLFLNALIWLVFGALIIFVVVKVECYFNVDDGQSGMFIIGHVLLTLVHVLMATRTLLCFILASIGFIMSVGMVGYDLYLLGKTFLRIFKRMKRSRLIPPPKRGVAYRCDFEDTAQGLYQYIRLRTIWYETVYHKKAPIDYQQAIAKLEKLDKTYQRYNKIALERRIVNPRR